MSALIISHWITWISIFLLSAPLCGTGALLVGHLASPHVPALHLLHVYRTLEPASTLLFKPSWSNMGHPSCFSCSPFCLTWLTAANASQTLRSRLPSLTRPTLSLKCFFWTPWCLWISYPNLQTAGNIVIVGEVITNLGSTIWLTGKWLGSSSHIMTAS